MQSHHDSGPDCGFPHGDARLDSRICIPLPSQGKLGTGKNEATGRCFMHEPYRSSLPRHLWI